jgi:hypothetical protein
MSTCDLGNHESVSGRTQLNWCCPDCLETYRRNVNEIATQAQLDREAKIASRRSPYWLVPYAALMWAFLAFLLVFFVGGS